jgi:hypothetical protein
MLFSNEDLFSDEQAITDTAESESEVSFGSDDIGEGRPVYITVKVVEDFAAEDGDETLTIALQDKGTGSFADTGVSSAALAISSLKAGDIVFRQPLPEGSLDNELRLNYTVAGTGDFTAGKITAGLTM